MYVPFLSVDTVGHSIPSRSIVSKLDDDYQREGLEKEQQGLITQRMNRSPLCRRSYIHCTVIFVGNCND